MMTFFDAFFFVNPLYQSMEKLGVNTGGGEV